MLYDLVRGRILVEFFNKNTSNEPLGS